MPAIVAPKSPHEAAAFLIALDPPFETELEVEALDDLNYHRLKRIFAQYFGVNSRAFLTKRIQLLCEWPTSIEGAGLPAPTEAGCTKSPRPPSPLSASRRSKSGVG